MHINLNLINKATGEKISGQSEYQDTIDTIINDLLNENVIPNTNVHFEYKDGSRVPLGVSLQNLNINDGDDLYFIISSSIQPGPNPDQFLGKRKSPQTFHQLGIFVLDGSYSMNDPVAGHNSKKDAVNEAVSSLLTKFKESRSVKNFSFSAVFFGEHATEKLSVTPLSSINENDNYDPTVGHNKATLVHTGLDKAETIANTFLSGVDPDDVEHSVVIMLLSDGECHEPKQTIEVANRIKNNPNINICTTFFEAMGKSIPEAESLMKTLASGTTSFSKTYDSDTLRKFFENSLSNIAI